MAPVLRKLRLIAGELGIVNTLLYGIDRMLAPRSRGLRVFRYQLVAQPVRQGLLLPHGRGRSIVVREVPTGDPSLAMTSLTPAVLNHRYAQGAVCLGAFKDEALVGYIWLCLGPYLEDEVRCIFMPLPKGRAAWDFDMYIQPEYRSGIAFARLWDAAMVFLRERGICWSMSRISAFNPLSLASHQRIGAQCVASATFVCLGRWQIMVTGLAPFLHISTGPTSVARLEVRSPRP